MRPGIRIHLRDAQRLTDNLARTEPLGSDAGRLLQPSPMFRKLKGRLFLVLLLAAFAGDASARPPRPHTESVVIESVDHTMHALRLLPADGCERLTVVWDRRTRFVAGDRLSTASRLQPGGRADVSYRTPFFGERYATKIVLTDSAATRPRP